MRTKENKQTRERESESEREKKEESKKKESNEWAELSNVLFTFESQDGRWRYSLANSKSSMRLCLFVCAFTIWVNEINYYYY